MEPSEIQVEENRFYRLFQKFSQESRLVVLVSVCMIATLVAVLTSVLAINSATHAKAMVEYELQATRDELTEAKNRTTLYIVYVQELQSDLITNGFQPPPLPEE